MFWRENPLLRVLFAYAPGIGLGLHWETGLAPPVWTGMLCSVLLLLMLWQWRGVSIYLRQPFGLSLMVWFFMFGLWRAEVGMANPGHSHVPSPVGNLVVGLVESPGPEAEWQRVELSVLFPGTESASSIGDRVMIYAQGATGLSPGDTLLFKASFEAPRSAANPEAFDYAAWLRGSGIFLQAFVRKGEYQVKSGSLPSLGFIAWRQKALLVLEKILPDEDSFGVGAALLLGYRDELDRELRDAYQDAGAMHVLAVSGMHVGLVYVMLGFLLFPLQIAGSWGRALSILLQLGAIWFFIGVAGAPLSARRAGIMFSLFSLGRIGFRQSRPHNTLALAALLILCLRPGDLLDVGFQLSFLAVGGIVTFQPALSSLWSPTSAWLNYPWQLICVSLSAQLATAPVCLYYFHQWPVYFLLSGLLAVPAASLIMACGLPAILLHGVPVLGGLLAKALSFLISGLNYSTVWISALPGATSQGLWLDEIDLFPWFAMLLFLAILCLSRRWSYLLPALGSLACCLLLQNWDEVQSVKQRAIAIYETRDGTLIDVLEGQKCFTLASSGIESKQEEYAAGLFRRSRHIKNKLNLPFLGSHRGPLVAYGKGMIQIEGVRLGLRKWTGVSLDVLVIGEESEVDRSIVMKDPPRWIVLDASLPFREYEFWRGQCEDLGIFCHDIREQGALVFTPDLQIIFPR